MKLAAICCTYKRPRELAEAVECFLRQDYPFEMRELIVLDDAGQEWPPEALAEIPNVKLVTTRHRFRTLGEKRNATAALAAPDVDAYCAWDDDDIYLPWHMSAAVAALAGADYTIPTQIYTDKKNRLERKSNQYLFHGALGVPAQAFEKSAAIPGSRVARIRGLLRRFKAAKLRRADPLQCDARPSYVLPLVHQPHTQHPRPSARMATNGLDAVPSDSISSLVPAWQKDWILLHEKAAVAPSQKLSKIVLQTDHDRHLPLHSRRAGSCMTSASVRNQNARTPSTVSDHARVRLEPHPSQYAKLLRQKFPGPLANVALSVNRKVSPNCTCPRTTSNVAASFFLCRMRTAAAK